MIAFAPDMCKKFKIKIKAEKTTLRMQQNIFVSGHAEMNS
jgi:uncharacterized protein YaaW (UPF0174 family)